MVRRQDDPNALQQTDECGRIVDVRPLVELIRPERPQDDRAEERLDEQPCRARGANRRREKRDRRCDETIGAVRFEKAVSRDRGWIAVVIAKAANERGAEQWRPRRPPCFF